MHALPDLDPVHQITIVPRGEAGGMTIYLPAEDRSYLSRSYMLDRIAGLLGGRAAAFLLLFFVNKLCCLLTIVRHNAIIRYGKSMTICRE